MAWPIWTLLSAVPRKAVKSNHSLTRCPLSPERPLNLITLSLTPPNICNKHWSWNIESFCEFKMWCMVPFVMVILFIVSYHMRLTMGTASTMFCDYSNQGHDTQHQWLTSYWFTGKSFISKMALLYWNCSQAFILSFQLLSVSSQK